MKAAAVLALGLWIVAVPADAQVIMPGAQPVSPDVYRAFSKAKDDPTDLMRLAEAGQPDAMTYAGIRLAFGQQSEADRKRGCDWLEAASAARADAMHSLGEAFQYGFCGGRIDLARAAATFRKAGDMGMAKSRCAEGNVLLESGGDGARAVELCRQGAEVGDPDAQTDLGNFYLQGRIVTRDMAAARGWYEKAAAQNQANATFILGQIYWNGDGVAKDNAKAAQMWRAAYARGREDAAFYLGNEAFLRAGRGDGKWDAMGLAEARDWYAKAVDARNPEVAKQARERRDLADQLIGVMERKKK